MKISRKQIKSGGKGEREKKMHFQHSADGKRKKKFNHTSEVTQKM